MAILKLQRAKQSGDRAPQSNRLGTIFKGAPKQGNTVGKNLDYFRFVANGKNAEQAQELWDRFYMEPNDGKPREIVISFPYNNIEWILDEWFREYGKSGIKVKCDGETIVEWRDDKGIYHTDRPKPCRAPNSSTGCDACKARDLFKVKIFEFEQFGLDGIVVIGTGAIHDLSYLRDRLTELNEILADANVKLKDALFVLYRETRVITKTINGRSSRGEESLLGLSFHPVLQKELNKAFEKRLYATVKAIGQSAAIPISGVTQKALPSMQSTYPAIAPTQDPDIVKKAFTAELNSRGLDTESKTNRAIIGETLIALGYTKIGSDGETIFGDANKIPIDLIKQVANKVEDALNGANLTTTVDVEAIATQSKKPLRTANPDDIQGYLDSTVPVKNHE